MKTKLKITLAAVLILLMSSGVAMALSVDYTIDLNATNRNYKHFSNNKLGTFDFGVDLDNVVINSVTLSVNQWKNWNRKSKEIWGVAIGDDFYRFKKSPDSWGVVSFDVTNSFQLGSPFILDLILKGNNSANLKLDWLTLTIDYDEIAGVVGGSETDPNGNGSPAPVPEPGTLVLLGAGLLVAARFGFRKFK